MNRTEADMTGKATWILRTEGGEEDHFRSVAAAHYALVGYAQANGLDVHLHPGNWQGSAISTAYLKNGCSLLDARAVVRVVFDS